MGDVRSVDPDSKPRLRDSIRWWHIALASGFVILLTIIAPRGKSPEFAHLSFGSISPAKIIAPFDFEILKGSEELNEERDQAARAVPSIFVRNDSAVVNSIARFQQFGEATSNFFGSLSPEWLKTIVDSTDAWGDKASEPFLRGSQRITADFNVRLNWSQWRYLFQSYLSANDHHLFTKFFNETGNGTLKRLYKSGILINPELESLIGIESICVRTGNEEQIVVVDSLARFPEYQHLIYNYLQHLRSLTTSDSQMVYAVAGLIGQFVQSNLKFDPNETSQRRLAAVNKVPLAKGFVKQDELIIDRHIKVSEDHLSKLHSLAVKRAEISSERGGILAFLPVIGQIAMILMLTAFMMLGIALAKPEVWNVWQRMVLIYLLLSLVLIFYSFVPIRFGLSRQLFPAALAGMLMTILLGKSIAALGIVTLGLAGGLLNGNDYQTTTIVLANGGVAIMSLRSLQSRRDVVKPGLYLAAVSLTLVFGFYLISYAGESSILSEAGIALAVAFLSPIIVLGVVPLIETPFGITTDLTLLELVDLNQPLLRQLAIKSPGTYHHSLMVGSLAEAAARSIGANPLLTRAGAYYHDIGKMEIREYFIENQETGSENIHDRLPPSESARIVIDHVSRGIELAEQHKLPREIKAFITEHHGKTRLAYFFSKASREQGRVVDEAKFRYGGPKPQSRETAILMLADGIEAATRSLDHPSPQEMSDLVDKFVSVRLSEGDLDECPLHLKELSQIKASFLNILIGIHHQRIQYPETKRLQEGEPGKPLKENLPEEY